MKTLRRKKISRKTQKKHPKIYDFIILGGGIAGINTAYKLSNKYPEKTILLLEKTNRFGGRIYSVNIDPSKKKDPNYTLEAGAGRFSQKHEYLQKLIHELKLESKIIPSSANAEYFPVKTKEERENPESSTNTNTNIYSNNNFSQSITDITPLLNLGIIYETGQESKLSQIVVKVIIASKLESREYLQERTFLQYAENIISKAEIEYIKAAFGYYSELVIMNAYDAIELMQQLGPNNQYYVLKGGLSQIIERMISIIKKNPKIRLSLEEEVKNIIPIKSENQDKPPEYEYKIKTNRHSFLAKTLISALPRQNIEKFRIFKPIRTILNKLKCGILCRIYARFLPEDYAIFKNLPKFTTNNHIRMFIPMNEKTGIIMISYSDNKYAEYWNSLQNKKQIIQKWKAEFYESTGIHAPEPVDIYVYYWKCGVGYWGIGANSKEISQRMIQPIDKYPNLFCCGEPYSEKNQQWIEGALETSENVITKIKSSYQ